MNAHSSYYPPGPREPGFAALPNAASYPPPPSFFTAARDRPQWDPKPPISQSRPYVSPDPSPIKEWFEPEPLDTLPPALPHHSQGFPISPVFHHPANIRPPGAFGLKPGMPHQVFQPPAPEVDPWYNPVMVAPPKQHRRNSKASKKVEGKQPTFLTKLYALLEQPEYHHIIRWDELGESIIIEKPDELADKILPVVYRQSRFASFSRQLNIYGFNRKLSLRHVEPGVCDPDASTWSHPFLRRSSTKEEILAFKRRVPPRPTQAQKRRQSIKEEGLSPSSGSDHSFQSPPDPYQHHLLPDVDEEKPFDFYPANPFAGQSPYLSHGPYVVDNQTSPSSMDFDYELPHDALEAERLVVSHTPRPLQGPQGASTFRFFDPNLSRSPPNNMPQTAPANTTTFPIPIRVTQQHIRTRSVQGEPPSAMLFSPMSPYNADSWLPGDIPMPSNGSEHLSVSPASQTSPLAEPVPWNVRGLTNLPSRNASMLHHANPSRFVTGPQSLPTEYNSGYLSRASSFSDSVTLAPHQTFSALSEDSPISPNDQQGQTVSLGIYQGFSLPPGKPTFVNPMPAQQRIAKPAVPAAIDHAPSYTQARQERRSSISSSPYSPRSKVQSLSLGASIRTVVSRRGSETVATGLDLNLDSSEKNEVEEDDQALPSASINLADQHPFEGILGDRSAEMDQA